MMHFENVAAQGELTITKIKNLPGRVGDKVAPVEGKLIVGHSETGHHHVVDAGCAELTRIDQFTAFLSVSKETKINHLRDHDTHPSIALQPGMYEIRTGREYDPFEHAIRASAD